MAPTFNQFSEQTASSGLIMSIAKGPPVLNVNQYRESVASVESWLIAVVGYCVNFG